MKKSNLKIQSDSDFKASAKKAFRDLKGGTKPDVKVDKSKDDLTLELKTSFDSLFPEVMENIKCRKHVMFDADIFEAMEGISKTSGKKISVVINAALREFINEKLAKQPEFQESNDLAPLLKVIELVKIAQKGRKLIKEIHEIKDLVEPNPLITVNQNKKELETFFINKVLNEENEELIGSLF